jgi:catechol 2,3-dioxygenase-like lactoylglutathione lyase family enzyme
MLEIVTSSWPEGMAVTQVRVARPTDKLDEVVRFYTEGLGLTVLGGFDNHAGYDGIMVGLPGADYHLEFTSHVDGSPCPAPTQENLLVFYMASEEHLSEAVERVRRAGYQSVGLENPYWADNGGIGFEDPDGWRVVFMPKPVF